ncbi:MAG: folate-binding protein YgfZ [Silvibacterium sp.]|nr:folate-binding protein YgfZ [Silvibacterium sp.]MBV8435947.1 folate-binding protein YgfZ [Silvibacterium sp.]
MGAAPQLADSAVATPLAAHLQPDALTAYRGALTAATFSGASPELAALTASAGIYDLGYLSFLKITGADRIRWLNGMVTNTVQSLEDHHSNYSFLLNAQGRILGDATIYLLPDHLLFQTDRAQTARLAAHLDHYIIMDEVELHELDASTTVLGVAGPRAPELLRNLGLPVPDEYAFTSIQLNGVEITIAHSYSPLVPRFELWLSVDALPSIWSAVTNAGAVSCGTTALESLRIMSGIPLYGVDIQERHLAQETGQARALNFNKGCYLGQEIVERIRSRATIHRILWQFSLSGDTPAVQPGQTLPLNAEQAERNPIGELSSIARIELPAFTGTVALGFIRTEVLERKLPITYSGGAATPLDAPPQITQD